MPIAFEIAKALSIVAFLGYGLTCLFSEHMTAEFERYGLARLRKLTGGLEVAGALGLLAGYLVPALVLVASGGLCVLMALGVAARIRVRDPLQAMLPALFFLAVNAFILVRAS